MFLTPHFTLEEMCKSQTAERHGIANDPMLLPNGPAIVESVRQVCMNVLEPVRDFFRTPIIPNSGYRCVELNRAIGGARSSQHIVGEAVDFELAPITNFALASWIRDNLDFDQLILEFYTPGQPNSGWVHCSFVPNANRRELLTINKQGTMHGLIP